MRSGTPFYKYLSKKDFARASRFAVHDVVDLDMASGDALDDKVLAAWAYVIGTGAQIRERQSVEVIQLRPAAGGNLCFTEHFRSKHRRLSQFLSTCSPKWKNPKLAADGINSLHDVQRFLLGQREFKRLDGVISPCPASGAVPRTRYGTVRVVKGTTKSISIAAPWRIAATAPAKLPHAARGASPLPHRKDTSTRCHSSLRRHHSAIATAASRSRNVVPRRRS